MFRAMQVQMNIDSMAGATLAADPLQSADEDIASYNAPRSEVATSSGCDPGRAAEMAVGSLSSLSLPGSPESRDQVAGLRRGILSPDRYQPQCRDQLRVLQ